jgi:pimeloyl-ACP methyl ester carboxylesterase
MTPGEWEADLPVSAAEGARRLGVPAVDDREPRSGTFATNGVRLHYLDWAGDAPQTILCLHGGSANAHVWDFIALGLASRYRVVALDQRGHGDSEWDPAGRYDRETYLGDIEATIRHLGTGPVVLMAHSMGGTNALIFTAKHPSLVRALVQVEAGPEIAQDAFERADRARSYGPPEGSYDSFVQQAMQYSRWWEPWHIHYHLHSTLRRLPDGRWTWKTDPALRSPERRGDAPHRPGPQALWPLWEGLQCPTLIVRGSFSRIFPPNTAAMMQRRLAGSRLVEIEGAGHRVHEDRPAELVSAVVDFLVEVDRGAL